MNDRHDDSEFPRTRARGRPRRAPDGVGPVDRMRAILERFADPGGWTKDTEAELAERFGVSPHTIEVDACNVSNFLALFEEVGGAKPFLVANLTSMVVSARMQGRIGEGAQAAQVLAKITGDIAPNQNTTNIQVVAQLFDLKTGELNEAGKAKVYAEADSVVHALVEDAVARLPESERDAERDRLWELAGSTWMAAQGKASLERGGR
jgi:hypothetical protein